MTTGMTTTIVITMITIAITTMIKNVGHLMDDINPLKFQQY
jgi:hypothetical protein